MASIVFEIPDAFKHVQYINATIYLAREFENRFEELAILKVDLKIFKVNSGEQYSFVYERESHDIGYVMIPFVQYIVEDKITELSNVNDFTIFIETILLKLSNEYTLV
ncbi:hypothetical protein L0669_10795 [Flavobacterium bizetiae]|uniref:hypothetical protein n=1 Tax=Flavobacterium bizetiae TaxID=2704140 RepID=UPI0021E8FC6C|nr:hypothetical protein [Flavobacterium bizetiae]UTN06371.1 hypothetical protein L0669_10795 [Flavobacterium bizetiae]